MDWYPWGDEALSRAQDEDRPILLSIGYSACHWCHVMERESFEDRATATVMNDAFVCIKVDREERPDIDAIYMRSVQALTGRGGWPLTVFLTPRREPFYGGTYFPPEPRQGMPSFRQVLEAADSAWKDRRKEVQGAADEIRALLDRSNLGAREEGAAEPALDESLIDSAASLLLRHLDRVHGGFGRAPKFPQPVVLQFLLERHALTGTQAALDAVLLTLGQLARGGIRDHLGGGFHRYAVDAGWLVPHFEKMLYDNALLADVYLRAFQLTEDPSWERVCREVLDDLIDDFRSPEGGFYTARDADSEGEEGRFYLWTPLEISDVLGPEDGRLFARCYDVTEEGNFEGRNILHLPRPLDVVAREEGLAEDELEERLRRSREKLRSDRARREPPLRDEKILASWNGLTLRTLADAGAALEEPRYVEAAVRGARWLMEALRTELGLLHQITGETAKIPAFLDDVAGMGNALLSLHEATLDPRWLDQAIELDTEVERRFRDPETGLLHDTPSDGESLLIRPREATDSPLPSGTSLAAELRLRLGRVLGDGGRIAEARTIVEHEAPLFDRMPTAFGRFLCVAGRLLAEPIEIVVVGLDDDPLRARLLHAAHRRFLPGRVITGADPRELADGEPDRAEGDREDLLKRLPLLEGRGLLDGRAAAYLCRGFTCERPTADPGDLASQMDALREGESG